MASVLLGPFLHRWEVIHEPILGVWMPALIDLTGKIFGRWTVLARSLTKNKNASWFCRCECGTEKSVFGDHLKRGTSLSCGCLPKELTAKRSTTHGLRHDRLYILWQHVVQRTTNPNDEAYHNYGGRGIKMHPKWENNPESFIKYLRMALGPKPTRQHSLDRIDNEQGYIPGNLRWATKKEQANNQRPRQRKSA